VAIFVYGSLSSYDYSLQEVIIWIVKIVNHSNRRIL